MNLQELENEIYLITSNRKKQLFALACAKSVQYLMTQQSKDCLTKTELFIDGKIGKEEFESARQRQAAADWDADYYFADAASYWAARAAELSTTTATANAVSNAAIHSKQDEQSKLKCIYNPNLIPLTFPTKAIQLAEEIYDTNNQTTRLILSDFLEENYFPEELYQHLKLPTHHKGCWVIDQILEKT